MRFARFVHAGGVSFGVVEGEAGAGVAGLTVAEIDRTPFEPVTFTNKRWLSPTSTCSPRSSPAR